MYQQLDEDLVVNLISALQRIDFCLKQIEKMLNMKKKHSIVNFTRNRIMSTEQSSFILTYSDEDM